MTVGLVKLEHMLPIEEDGKTKNKHGPLKWPYLYQINFQSLHSPNKVVDLPTFYLNT